MPTMWKSETFLSWMWHAHTHTHINSSKQNEIFIKSVLNASYATPIYSVPFGSLSSHAILIPLFKITHKNDLTSFQWVITYNLKKTSQLFNGILSYVVRGFYSSLARQKHTVKYILGESLRKASWKRIVQNLLMSALVSPLSIREIDVSELNALEWSACLEIIHLYVTWWEMSQNYLKWMTNKDLL